MIGRRGIGAGVAGFGGQSADGQGCSPSRGSSLLRFAGLCRGLQLGLMLCCAGVATAQVAVPPSLPPDSAGSPARAAQKTAAGIDAAPRFRITGVVVNATTRSPVAGAELSVAAMTARRVNGGRAGRASGQTVAAVSDASGHFDIEVPSAGGWSITASAHGYHTQSLDEHEGYSTAIVLTEAAPAFDVMFRLPPASVIEGYVVDEAGEPVRNGQLTLSLIPAATPENDHPRHQVRGNQRTDDRGYYKFSGLMAGNYELRLQAQPWYASSGVGQRFGGGGIGGEGIVLSSGGNFTGSGAPAAPDPLDVVYPVVWYPGVADFSAAAPLALRAGEVREADFRMSPIPGFHLRMAVTQQNDENRRNVLQGGYLTQILPDGSEAPVAASTQTDAQGSTEFSGLAPGTYQVHRQGENGRSSTAIVQISPNSTRTLDMNQDPSSATVTIKVDPAADLPSLQVTFRDTNSGRTTSAQSSRTPDGRGGRRRPSGADAGAAGGRGTGSDQSSDRPADRSISLLPGRYEVSLGGVNDLHLTSIEATGATAVGRTVTIGGGAPALMLHVAAGRANLTGFVRRDGVPVAGAMVLLVPATLGDPAGLGISRRDQSNSDGSFDILDILPGAYILIAVDHGWDVNWRDPATLRRFLMHGVPLDLSVPGDSKAMVQVQSP